MPTSTWLLIGLWSALIVYVFIDVRRIMAFNGKWNAKLGLPFPTEVTDRAVLINRAVLVALLVAGNWLIHRWLA